MPSVSAPERFAARPIGSALAGSPYQLIGADRQIRHAPKHLLVPVSKTLELMALEERVPPLVLAAFEDVRFFRPSTVRRFTELAVRLPFVAALGVGMPSSPAPGVRGAALSPQDPLAREWTVVVLGAHMSAALIALDLGDDGADPDRQFAFVVTYDRRLVTAAAQSMVGRVTTG
ncbi:DICT sensory domain-containing protein [Actinoplanes sp. CA-252034]|uniref:DICT sensory domain-containing protein n=1 Tax=Actinoplanes sp. CA-252034 TaxID=3239906 RepID=UPI003D9559CD